jgi:hypothetical protein
MPFAPRGSAAEIEEGRAFAPKFDAAGLIACVVAAADSGEVLMVAHMNAQALARTLESGSTATRMSCCSRSNRPAPGPATPAGVPASTAPSFPAPRALRRRSNCATARVRSIRPGSMGRKETEAAVLLTDLRLVRGEGAAWLSQWRCRHHGEM